MHGHGWTGPADTEQAAHFVCPTSTHEHTSSGATIKQWWAHNICAPRRSRCGACLAGKGGRKGRPGPEPRGARLPRRCYLFLAVVARHCRFAPRQLAPAPPTDQEFEARPAKMREIVYVQVQLLGLRPLGN